MMIRLLETLARSTRRVYIHMYDYMYFTAYDRKRIFKIDITRQGKVKKKKVRQRSKDFRKELDLHVLVPVHVVVPVDRFDYYSPGLYVYVYHGRSIQSSTFG